MVFQRIKKFFTLSFLLIIFLISISFVKADLNCQDMNPSNVSAADADICYNQLKALIDQYLPAQEKNKKDLAGLQSQLNNINQRISALSKQLQILAANIQKREEDLAYTKKIFEEKTSNYYKSLRMYEPSLLIVISSSDVSDAFRQNILRQRATEGDRSAIDMYAKELTQLKEDKAGLEKNKESLAAVQKQVAEKTSFLAAEVAKVDAYLATLSAKQQAFLAAKLESLGISRSAYNLKGGCTDDRNVDPGFSPRIAFFTYGVPNRVGLNQFGAKGRAEAGQGYEEILRAYYNFDQIAAVDQSTSIHILGTNEFGQPFDDYWSIEEYLKHLYEMPTNWSGTALRAQAIAARSYALRVQRDQGYVRPSQADQVVKRELNDGNWISAVSDTGGKVMLQGGVPIKAWFSSTHGGFVFTSADIWGGQTAWTKRMVDAAGGVGSFSDLFNTAYDKNSPFFYCDWGGRSQYNKTAWLKPDELADIVNVVLLARADSSTREHLYQLDKQIADTWDIQRVKDELSNRGITPLESVGSVDITGVDWGTGRVTQVTVDGRQFSGQEFKDFFNLRAPSNIQIVGPLYNVERR